MKKLLLGILLLSTTSTFANDCEQAAKNLEAFEKKNTAFARMVVIDQVEREKFVSHLYYEDLVADEGRSLYIPHGRYDSLLRSIDTIKANKDKVAENASSLHYELLEITKDIRGCLNN